MGIKVSCAVLLFSVGKTPARQYCQSGWGGATEKLILAREEAIPKNGQSEHDITQGAKKLPAVLAAGLLFRRSLSKKIMF